MKVQRSYWEREGCERVVSENTLKTIERDETEDEQYQIN